MSIQFAATGGEGPYTWTILQAATGVLDETVGAKTFHTVTYLTEKLPNLAMLGAESANYHDAPGFIPPTGGTYTITLVQTFFDYVQVESFDGQTAPCPVVEWVATTTITSKKGSVTASGKAWLVQTFPPPAQ